MVLRVFSLVYNAFRIPIETEDVVKIILMLSGCRFRRAFIFLMFSVSLIGSERIMFFFFFFFNSKELLPSLEMVTLKSSSDSEWPFGVISGFSISNFNLGCRLFIVEWNWSAISSLVVWR